jgi:hypothetical protein
MVATYAAADDHRPVEVRQSTGRTSDRTVPTPFTENLCDVLVGFAKSTFEKHVKSIGMLKLSEIP